MLFMDRKITWHSRGVPNHTLLLPQGQMSRPVKSTSNIRLQLDYEASVKLINKKLWLVM